MKNVAFPWRNSTKRELGIHAISCGVEIFTDRKIDADSVRSLGEKNFSGSMKFHYLADAESSDLENILAHAGIGDFIAARLARQVKPYGQSRQFRIPSIMAVANATPDSFHHGSRLGETNELLDSLLDAKPDIIDVGGESTRPGSDELPIREEISRIEPVIEHIASSSRIPISLDTRHPEVLEHFADKIQYANDVSGFRDNRMVRIAADNSLKCITMHMRGTPADMQSRTEYVDLVPEVLAYLVESAEHLEEAGVKSQDIIIDPGIGFSKDFIGNLEILSEIQSFSVGYQTLVGASRKTFIGKITGEDTEGRLPGTLAVTAFLAEKGVGIIRVHDPKENIQLLKVLKAVTEGKR